MKYPKTPTLDAMNAVHEKSQAIGEFIEVFMAEKGFHFGQPHKHTNSCQGWIVEGGEPHRLRGVTNDCGLQTGEFVDCSIQLEKLLAEFFGIDLEKAEKERRAVLAYVRKQNL